MAAPAPRIGVYSGTFDPITLGHIDVIVRAAALFDTLIVAVASAHHKKTLFSLEERAALAQTSLAAHPTIRVVPFDGLIVECCKTHGAQTLVRGVRNGTDMDYEGQMAQMNRSLAPQIDTIFLRPSPQVQAISSTLVREISKLGGRIDHLVPPAVASALAANQRKG